MLSLSPRIIFVAKIVLVLCLLIATLFLCHLSYFVIEHFNKPTCVSTHEVANATFEIDTNNVTLSNLENKFKDELLPGGWYKPMECVATYKVAVIVPFLNEVKQMPVFLNNIHSFLMKQQIEYRVFLIKQSRHEIFNRGMLFNIGFVEAQKLNQWDCYVFHDVTFIPMDNRNLYRCLYQPHHMAVNDRNDFKLPYANYFGDVSAMTKKQFEAVNGYSDLIWNLNGEYDDMYNRIERAGYEILRYPLEYAHYTVLNSTAKHVIIMGGANYENGSHSTGLNTLKYKVINRKDELLCTCIWVETKNHTAAETHREHEMHSTMKPANETSLSIA